MSGPRKVTRTVVLLAVAGMALSVLFADAVIDWVFGLGIWILFFPHIFVASLLVAGLGGALVALAARRFAGADDWQGLAARVGAGIWIALSIAMVALSE